MKRFLLLPLLAVLFISFQSCEKDEPDNTPDAPGQETPTPSEPEEPENPGTQTPETPKDQSVVINQDGTTSTGVPFRWETNSTTIFYLNHVKYKIVDSHVEVIGVDSYELEHTLKGIATLYSPITLNGYTYPLRVLQNGAFSNSNLISIEIPASVIDIRFNVFSECKNLASIKLNKGLETIREKAFYQCTSLESITLDGIKTISINAFEGCSSLKTFNLYNAEETRLEEAFKGCNALESITIKGLNVISYFENLPSLKSITLENVNTIATEAFSWCTSLKSISLLKGLHTIGNRAFSGCVSLETINLPEGLHTIGNRAFRGCISLETINLPEGLSTLDCGAFENCTLLKEVIFPSSIEYINEDCFDSCKNLTSIIIPEGSQQLNFTIYSIGNCDSLKTLDLPSNANPEYFFQCNDRFSSYSVFKNMKINDVYLHWKSPYKYYDKNYTIPPISVTNLHIPNDLKNWYLEYKAQNPNASNLCLYGFDPENIIVLEE